MGRSDFEARLERLTKVPSTGAKRAVNKAMLQDKIGEMRSKEEEERAHLEELGADSWSTVLVVLLTLSSLSLAGLFAHDPEDAKRKAVIMVPLMLLVFVTVVVRLYRRKAWDMNDFPDVDFDLD